MAAKKALADDTGEKRQRIRQELLQLKQMSKTLRTRSMRSFLERAAKPRSTLMPAKAGSAA